MFVKNTWAFGNNKYLSQRFKKEFELVSHVNYLQDTVAAKAFQYWVRNSALY